MELLFEPEEIIKVDDPVAAVIQELKSTKRNIDEITFGKIMRKYGLYDVSLETYDYIRKALKE